MTVVAVCAIGNAITATALAEEKAGPLWLAKGLRFLCKKGADPETFKWKSLLSCIINDAFAPEGEWEAEPIIEGEDLPLRENQVAYAVAAKKTGSANFKLKTTLITIECTVLSAPMALEGGMPPRDHAWLKFTGCFVAGHATCTVNSPGEAVGSITTIAKAEVIYLGNDEEALKEEGPLGDYFSAEEGNALFEIDIGGTGCPLFTKGEQEVDGGVIAEITPVNSMGTLRTLVFPAEPIEFGYAWVKTGEVEEVTSGLKIFGTIDATLSGEVSFGLESGEPFGVRTFGT